MTWHLLIQWQACSLGLTEDKIKYSNQSVIQAADVITLNNCLSTEPHSDTQFIFSDWPLFDFTSYRALKRYCQNMVLCKDK